MDKTIDDVKFVCAAEDFAALQVFDSFKSGIGITCGPIELMLDEEQAQELCSGLAMILAVRQAKLQEIYKNAASVRSEVCS